MNKLQKIQQDIEKFIDESEQALGLTDALNYADVSAIRASFNSTMYGCRILADLLLRLSKVKPTGLYPSSANDESPDLADGVCFELPWSKRAATLMVTATIEARKFNCPYIGTEHILLGLLRLPDGIAVAALRNMGVDLAAMRHEIDTLVRLGAAPSDTPKLPLTPRAKKVLKYAFEEAKRLKCAYIGSEHILLGLLWEREGIAAQVLFDLDVTIERVTQEVKELLGRDETIPKEETPALPQRQTLRELSKNGQKVRKRHWAPEEYVVLDSDGRMIEGTLSTSGGKIGSGQLDFADDWEVYDDTVVDTTHVHEKRAKEEEEGDESPYRFYYCHSEDAYLLGLRVGNFYYARWRDGGYFQFEMSRHLPWGKIIPTDDGGCYRYPSKPVELDFQLWLKGFLAQRADEVESKKPVARRYEEKKLYRWDGKDFVPWEEKENDPVETGANLTLRELSKDGQKVRKSAWSPKLWLILDSIGKIVEASRGMQYRLGSVVGLDQLGWELYEEPESVEITAEETPVPPQRQTLRESKTMTGYEAVKLLMAGKTVSRWNVHFKVGGHVSFALTKENLEATDWIEVTDE